MRARAWMPFALATICGCHPSASVQSTLPIANLQSYGTVGLRVSSATTRGQTGFLESQLIGLMRQQCGFTQIERKSAAPVDVVVDLNITAMGRGGDNHYIKNPNEATIDTLLVLTDGHTGELLGTSRIHGSSSSIGTANTSPEREALDVVARTVVGEFAKSGCTGPRIARVDPTPPPPAGGSATGEQPPAAAPHRDEADALNAQGTEKLQSADAPGALAMFQQANALAPDPKYVFNACLTLESEAQWDQAIATCKQARGMGPDARLAAKIDHRLDLLAQHQ